MQTNREGIWIIDADGRTTYASERMAEILRTSCSEMIGNPSFAYVYPEDAVAAQRLFDVKKDGNATAFTSGCEIGTARQFGSMCKEPRCTIPKADPRKSWAFSVFQRE